MDQNTAKRYNRIKLILSLSGMIIDLLFWLVIIFSGVAISLANVAYSQFSLSLFQFYLFVIILAAIYLLINFPFSFASGFLVERRFSLSNQTFLQWVWEQVKGLLVAAVLGGVVLTIFYLLLVKYPNVWWVGVWLFLLIFSVLLTRLAPTLIFPLFYKFEPLERNELKEKLQKMGERWGLKITGVFRFNLSKTTRKANAAFTGLGKSKRVILGDTLLNEFNEAEIESVFAHEIGHFVHRHLFKGILINSVLSLAGLYLVFYIYRNITGALHLSQHSLEALPYLGLLFFLFSQITSPLGNYISRRFEYQADRFAVAAMEKSEPFIESLKKLSRLNLADPDPHPLVEFLFYSHPSINNRIEKITGEKV